MKELNKNTQNSDLSTKKPLFIDGVSNSLLIAKFMGITPIKGIDNRTKKEYYYYNNFEAQDFEALPYYRDWEDLMLVVEKIVSKIRLDKTNVNFKTFGLQNEETKEYMVRIDRHQLFQAKTLIEAIYLSVVDFIKGWFGNDC